MSRRRVTNAPLSTGTSGVIERRRRQFEAEVAAGLRDARSLVAIPAEQAREAKVSFPSDPFGKPQPW